MESAALEAPPRVSHAMHCLSFPPRAFEETAKARRA